MKQEFTWKNFYKSNKCVRIKIFFLLMILGSASFFLAAKKVSIRIMPLGDSITAGYTDNPNWKHPFEFGYRSGLLKRMERAEVDFIFVGKSNEPFNKKFGDPTHGDSISPKYDIRKLEQNGHRGYGGWDILSIYSNISDWMRQDKPDIILLHIGINGISINSPNQLNDLVKLIFKIDNKVQLIVAQITPLSTFNIDLLNYNIFIKENLVPSYSLKGYSIKTVDLYQNFLTDLNDPKSINKACFSNKINHPTNDIYDKISESWFNSIKELLTNNDKSEE